MIEAFTAADVRAAEEPVLAAESGFAGGLMHRAATALALAVRRELRATPRPRRRAPAIVVGLVGPGNNGGDALHALAQLSGRGLRVIAVLTSAAVHEGGAAALRRSRGELVAVVDGAPGRRIDLAEAVRICSSADVLLDGLLGIGGRGSLRGAAREIIESLPAQPHVIAVDVPSGIGVDDGALLGPVLPAQRTVTFGTAKPGLLLPPACALAGTVEVVDLGLMPVLAGQGRRPAVRRLGTSDAAALLPTPRSSDHKYSRGVLGVVAGSPAFPGAAVLTVAGALGAGCGMVRHVAAPSVCTAVLAAHPEVVAAPSVDVHVQCWVVGPGVTDDDEQEGRSQAALDHALARHVPVVVDAGGLHRLPERLSPSVVLTPHAGELAHLLARYDVAADRGEVEAEPLRWAREAAVRTGATVLLKGSTTVVVGHDDSGHGNAGVVLAQQDAPAWLATAGAGDVLAGVLGAMLAARADELLSQPALVAELAATAAHVHGAAATRANPGGPITASAVAAAVPAVIAEMLTPRPALRRTGRRIRMHHAPLRRVVR